MPVSISEGQINEVHLQSKTLFISAATQQWVAFFYFKKGKDYEFQKNRGT